MFYGGLIFQRNLLWIRDLILIHDKCKKINYFLFHFSPRMVILYQNFFINIIKQGLSGLDTTPFCQLTTHPCTIPTFLQEVVKEIVSSKNPRWKTLLKTLLILQSSMTCTELDVKSQFKVSNAWKHDRISINGNK